MKKYPAKICVLKEEKGYSASVTIGNRFIATESEGFEDLKLRLLEALNLTFEEEGNIYTIEDLRFEYDLESFFAFYKVINAKALSERIGMNHLKSGSCYRPLLWWW